MVLKNRVQGTAFYESGDLSREEWCDGQKTVLTDKMRLSLRKKHVDRKKFSEKMIILLHFY